jgi:hypothetical protein
MNNNSKKYWGEPTWYLFHGIAAKIDVDYYKNNYKECFSLIENICYNLPCPYCRDHAIKYLKKTNTNQINTKEKLIRFLFDFHNHANKNSGKPLYDFEKMQIYNTILLEKVFNLFLQRFYRTYHNFKVFNSFLNNKNKKFVINWWDKHQSYLK